MRRKNKLWALVLLLFLLLAGYWVVQQNSSSQSAAGGFFAKFFRKEDLEAYQKKANQMVAEQTDSARIPVPLLLQKNKNWATVAYGVSDGSGNLAENGCAILCLAMLDSYFSQTEVTPAAIVDWSGDTYYVSGAGTSWEIFAAYCQQKGWDFQNLGNDLEMAKTALREGHPVIASVAAGTFTSSGHILLLTGGTDQGFYVNDPNDDATKEHFFRLFPWDTLQQEGVNYWSVLGSL